MGSQLSRATQEDVRRILDALRLLVRALRLSARDAERTVGVSGAQLFVLECLRAEGLTLKVLAERTATDPSSVSVVVKKLFEGGLVSRRGAPDDARSIIVSLTPRGKAAMRKSPPPSQLRLTRALEGLAPAQRRRLALGLGGLTSAMGLEGRATMFFEEEAPRRPKRRGR